MPQPGLFDSDIEGRIEDLAEQENLDPQECAVIVASFGKDLGQCDRRFLAHLLLLFAQFSQRLSRIHALAGDNPAILDLTIAGNAAMVGLIEIVEEALRRASLN